MEEGPDIGVEDGAEVDVEVVDQEEQQEDADSDHSVRNVKRSKPA